MGIESWLSGVSAISYGGDYNPEQWPEETWPDDIALMREAGVNLVSIGIFSWALIEPRPGEYDFGWMDRLFELLHQAGIRISLGTPTASPPAWFFHRHPEARVVTRDGTTLGFGSRGMASPSSSAYREASTSIARALAQRYGGHPALAIWHVHNEYGAPVSECYSEQSGRAFRSWLLGRYGSLADLNRAWGTAFWGQRYVEWEHVGVPARAASVVNPAQRLDFARFSSDALLQCFVAERDAIRAECPTVPITTNFMAGTCPSVDLWKWVDEVDLVANDHYLMAEDARSHVGLALSADLTRSLARGKPWLLMEHSPSGVNWQPRNLAKRPGELSRNALTHVGRGADAVMFFQWRASRSGAEKFHSAMVPHAGTRSRVWSEVRALGNDLGRLDEVRGTVVRAQAALLWDWESFWAQDLEWRPSADLSHRERIDTFYDRLWQDKLTVDFAHPETDLSGYRLVVAPASYLLTSAAAANLRRYVEQGGTLVVSYFSAIVDEYDAVHPGGFVAPLRDVLGLTVEEFLPLRVDERVQLSLGSVSGDVWADDIVVEGAEVVAVYEDGPAPGKPAITRNQFGAGAAWYVSTRLTVEDLAAVLIPAYDDAGITPIGGSDELELVRRRGTEADYVFAVNHSSRPVDLSIAGTDLLTGEAGASLKVEGGAVRVVRTPKEAGSAR